MALLLFAAHVANAWKAGSRYTSFNLRSSSTTYGRGASTPGSRDRSCARMGGSEVSSGGAASARTGMVNRAWSLKMKKSARRPASFWPHGSLVPFRNRDSTPYSDVTSTIGDPITDLPGTEPSPAARDPVLEDG